MSQTEFQDPTTETESACYGCDAFGRLRRVLLHRPGRALELVRDHNHRDLLFDAVPDPARFADEHDRYRELLESLGVEVLELADHVRDHAGLLDRLPNLTYLHDTAVVSRQGAILSIMAPGPRRGEERVVGEALGRLGIPLLHRFDGDDGQAFEGCLLLSPETLLVADTERHTDTTCRGFIPRALETFDGVIYARIPKARRFMHPDTIYNRVDHELALAFPPAFERTWLHTAGGVREIDFTRHMRERGVEIVEVSDDEQRRLACSFVPLEPGVVVHYDTALDASTRRRLARRGVELVTFHPEAMTAGGGSLRCLTLRLWRET